MNVDIFVQLNFHASSSEFYLNYNNLFVHSHHILRKNMYCKKISAFTLFTDYAKMLVCIEDRISRVDLHKETKLLSLEQRRENNCLL